MYGDSSRYNKLKSMVQDGSSEPCNATLEYLRNITNNFSDERVLGEGGFGTVYKGVLPNGEMIAVKKLNSSTPGVKDKHFENEAYHLMRLKHPNVVLLVGWCSETENIYVQYNGKYICAEKSERLLCLEYMPKGSLRGYLSDEASGLGWETRYKIIEGICYGLHYLHDEWQPGAPIIHMDLKPANILLDNNMVPKIADFGLSRLFSEEKTWTCTINRDGTLGYMAPEYINRGVISTKSDIFSLGVIIIEIVTGHRDYPDETGISPQEFSELVLKNWRNRLEQTVGYTKLSYQQIKRCIQIGLACVELDRSKRPPTSQIIKMLHPESSSRKKVWASTSEEPQKYTSSLQEECQPTKIEIDRPASLAGSAVCLRIGRSGDGGGDVRFICESLGLSGPDEFAIPIAERIDSQLGEALVRGRLLYLENRVALARILFPMEARIVTDNSRVDGTLEFTLDSIANPPSKMDPTFNINCTPSEMKEEHLVRMRALSKAVELGKRFFPSCSKVLDRIMDDETELASLGRETCTEKKRRFHKLQDMLHKAFSEDKEEFHRQACSFSSSSTTIRAI
ncbi:unnamed protein product [Urochloa decumbens]|uniref:Protein kinase domain-containing protein n=1 Tax=Urochloa decumbens TaxID=240449 RepID=A0ABC9E0P7_9POAL